MSTGTGTVPHQHSQRVPQWDGARTLGRAIVSAGTWCLLGFFTVGYSLLILLVAPVSFLVDSRRWRIHQLVMLWGRSVFWSIPLSRVTVTGREHIHPRRPYILVANHQSLLDIMALLALNRHFKWVAKASLFQIPFLGWSMALAGYIKLMRGRHGSIRATYDEAKRWLRSGVSVFFFPEGTRSRTGQLGAFKNGAFKLSLETGIPVVPIAIQGTAAILSRGRWMVRYRSHVRITVLRPLHPERYAQADVDQFREDTRRVIQATLQDAARV